LPAEIEVYYDAAPRTAARAEDYSPLVLFAQQGAGWPYYARPELGAAKFTAADVLRVRERQRELRLPEQFEWVAETSPGLRAAAIVAGLTVADHPLMVLASNAFVDAVPSPGITFRLATPEDDFALLSAVAHVGFTFPGTARGDAGSREVVKAIGGRNPEREAFQRGRLASGQTVTAVAFSDGVPVAVGSHQPVGAVTEVVGVATLPAYRRQGIGAALTALLTRDARARGVGTVFLSAGSDEIARVYERAGFERIGTACIAGPQDPVAAS
jgi:ribosomal protein S18 acetylase RimI-like enzyme